MSDWMDDWELVIGLEVHTHLKTESKLFSPARYSTMMYPMCRHAMASSSAAKFFDSPSGKSRPGRSIENSLAWSPTKSIGPPGQTMFSRPLSRLNMTAFQMKPTTATDSTTGK